MATADIKVAVVGDYGTNSEGTKKVATLIDSWEPNCIITTGENNYRKAEDFHQNVGAKYGKYISPSITKNRFWPCMGNHDFGNDNDPKPYLDYFPALNGKFYYDFVLNGTIHFFSLCSDYRCPDGIWSGSPQLLWAEAQIKQSQAPWKIVYLHHPPYSSAVMSPDLPEWPSRRFSENCERKIKLPFYDWGVSAVLSGHLHLYERFNINKDGNRDQNGVPYIINGAGGDVRYKLCDETRSSIVSYDQQDGAMLIEATDKRVSFKFMTTSGSVIDQFSLTK